MSTPLCSSFFSSQNRFQCVIIHCLGWVCQTDRKSGNDVVTDTVPEEVGDTVLDPTEGTLPEEVSIGQHDR